MIKKAYILARQVQEFQSVAVRVRAIFFLATPHRGADLAQLLTKLFNITSSPKPFVADLHRNSLATQSINDEFPHHCKDLQLYSFYETLPTSYGVGKGLIVDKDMAILGYQNERTAYLDANHRGVCKYSTMSDPNYITVRNALASTIDTFRDHVVTMHRDLDSEQRQLLDEFLGVSDAPEDDLLGVDMRRMRGSCEWLMARQDFQGWRDSTPLHIYWISARPATGKSVLAGHVINHLKELSRDCAFYFFNYSNKAKSTISSFLLSVAWQMACMHRDVLHVVLDTYSKDKQLSATDYRTVWRKLFLEGILKLKFSRSLYWVVDGLDECKSESELVPLLLKVTEVCPVRIFITSRYQFSSQKQALHSRAKVVEGTILEQDTQADIELHLAANMEHLPSVDMETRQDIVERILKKSHGCFLWVNLILQELRQVNTSTEIHRVLEEVPSDMNELYSRILVSMSRAHYGKVLAKAILTWVVCAARPLTAEELYHALQLDLKDTINDINRAIMACCGQLVYINAQSQVQMVHQTAREFLLRSDIESEFAIEKKEGHKRLALTCLEYLNGSEMKGPRHRKLSFSKTVKGPSPFKVYACGFFFEHMNHVSSTDDEILLALSKFLLSSNVLSWIEYLASKNNLNRLVRTGKALKNLLQRRAKHMSLLGKEAAIVDSWATDLVRLVTKFGLHLLSFPSSIFNLIPPFCPADTAPRKQFAQSGRTLTVLGLSAKTWDDCLSTIYYQQDPPSALAFSDRFFAVGLSNGGILLYHETTCQEAHSLQHEEAVRILQFGSTSGVLASSGIKTVRVWNVDSWQQLWKFDTRHMGISLAFIEEDSILLGALKNNQLMIWDLTDGILRDTEDWTQDLEGQRAQSFRRPTTAAFSTELSLLAVVYRGQDILLWDLEREALLDTYGKETGARSGGGKITNATVWCLVFSSAPAAELLAAGYSDGDLVLFDTCRGVVMEMVLAANAQILACSPDGQTLASGDSSGTIQLFDFETLKLMYRIRSGDEGIKSLAFSGNSQRLVSISGLQCRVWDPTVLVRQDTDEEQSDTISLSTIPQEVTFGSEEDTTLITALTCLENGEVFFYGKEDGSVYLHESKAGGVSYKLYSHADGVSIISLLLDSQSQTLCSVDSSSRIKYHKLRRERNDWQVGEATFDQRVGVAVHQLLSNKGHTRMLICSADRDTLYEIDSNQQKLITTNQWDERGPHRWGSHPQNPNQLILIIGNVAHIYDWDTLKRLTDSNGILLEGTILAELSIHSVTSCFGGTILATAFAEYTGTHAKSRLLLWDASDFTTASERAVPVPKYQYLTDQVELLVGAFGPKLIFLSTGGWICSTDAESFEVVRHFFIPADWRSTNQEVMMDVTRNGDVLFVKKDEVAVIKRGLETVVQAVQPASTTGSGRHGSRGLLAVPGPVLD